MSAPRWFVVALMACVFCDLWAQPARDPFAAAEAPAGDSSRGHAAEDYTVYGILLLRGHALAALKTSSDDFLVVRVGDKLGRDGGEVTRITVTGVSVRTPAGDYRLPNTF